MASCKDCIHFNICGLWSTTDLIADEAHKLCYGNFKDIADVVPRSEVEQLKMTLEVTRDNLSNTREELNNAEEKVKKLTEENEKLIINMNAYGLTAKRLAEENEKLRKAYLHYEEIAKRKVMSEIFEEIERIINHLEYVNRPEHSYHKYYNAITELKGRLLKLKKKYIGE